MPLFFETHPSHPIPSFPPRALKAEIPKASLFLEFLPRPPLKPKAALMI